MFKWIISFFWNTKKKKEKRKREPYDFNYLTPQELFDLREFTDIMFTNFRDVTEQNILSQSRNVTYRNFRDSLTNAEKRYLDNYFFTQRIGHVIRFRQAHYSRKASGEYGGDEYSRNSWSFWQEFYSSSGWRLDFKLLHRRLRMGSLVGNLMQFFGGSVYVIAATYAPTETEMVVSNFSCMHWDWYQVEYNYGNGTFSNLTLSPYKFPLTSFNEPFNFFPQKYLTPDAIFADTLNQYEINDLSSSVNQWEAQQELFEDYLENRNL